jgi:hypothetical protein
MGRDLHYVGRYLHFSRFFWWAFSLNCCKRAGYVTGMIFAYYIVMSNHTNKENTMTNQERNQLTRQTPLLNRLHADGLIYLFGGNYVGRTVDGIKFGIDENPEVVEQFLNEHWDAKNNGISVNA